MHTTGRTHQGRGAGQPVPRGHSPRSSPPPLAFLCGGSLGAAPGLPLTQFPKRRGGSRQVVLETSYSVQTGGRGGGFQSGDQAEPGPPPPLWPRGGRWAPSRVNSDPLRPRGLQEPASASYCGFPTWWWPAPGRTFGEESPPPCPDCSLHLALTSFPGANKDVPNLWAGRGSASSPRSRCSPADGAPSSSCSHRHWHFIWEMQWGVGVGDRPKCGGSFLLPGLQLCSGAPLSCGNTPLLPQVPWNL